MILFKQPSPGIKEAVRNPHFWVILILILAISSVYYSFDYARLAVNQKLPWLIWVILFEFQNDLHGSFLYIPMIYAALFFRLKGILIFWLVTLAVIISHIIYLAADTNSLISNIFFLSIPLACVGFITVQLKWRERERNLMKEREAEREAVRKAFISHTIKSQESERKRIAGELHDDILQTLLAIANQTQELLDEQPGGNGHKLEGIRDLIMDTSYTVRRISRDLRPSLLDNLGLLPSIRWLADQLRKETAITTEINIQGEVRNLNPDTEVIIFRFVQEALNNIKKHAAATRLVINIASAAESFSVSVEDNGKGFHLPKSINNFSTRGKLGLIGMQEKADTIGGSFNIASTPGRGTAVSIHVGA